MNKQKNQCRVTCLFAAAKKCSCVCQGLNHGRWNKNSSPRGLGSRFMEDRATLASDLSAIKTLDRGDPGGSKSKKDPRYLQGSGEIRILPYPPLGERKAVNA